MATLHAFSLQLPIEPNVTIMNFRPGASYFGVVRPLPKAEACSIDQSTRAEAWEKILPSFFSYQDWLSVAPS